MRDRGRGVMRREDKKEYVGGGEKDSRGRERERKGDEEDGRERDDREE